MNATHVAVAALVLAAFLSWRGARGAGNGLAAAAGAVAGAGDGDGAAAGAATGAGGVAGRVLPEAAAGTEDAARASLEHVDDARTRLGVPLLHPGPSDDAWFGRWYRASNDVVA